MSTRHEAREWAVQFLFQRDFNPGELDESLDDMWKAFEPDPKLKEFAEEIIQGVEEYREALDEKIRQYAENWSVERMGAVDRNVMRVALYEMCYRTDIPPVVSINEAVEIAKDLSGRESGRFVNGILDRARKDLKRPPRESNNEESVTNIGER